MADDADFKGQFTIDFGSAQQGARDLANAIATLNGNLEKSNPELTRAQTALAKIATGTQGAAAGATKTATATRTAAKATDQWGVSLSSTQYALFNVASVLTSVSRGFIAFAAAPAIAASNFQRDFAQVTRTVTGAGSQIMNQLETLSTQIPVTFSDLAEIASLGGQLGIAKGGIVDFTTVVAKLTATTNLSAEQAGTLLGRFQSIANVPSSKFGNLASAILKVGVTSVATETQIAQTATSIVGISKTAGFTVPQIIGLAGALASVGSGSKQVQAASGSITRFISNLQKDILTGNEGLTSFAKTAGVSAEEVRTKFGTKEFSGIFNQFIAGLDKANTGTGNFQQVLNDIGLTGVQDIRTFSNLAGATELLNKLTLSSGDAYKSTSVLNEQYGKISDTTSAKITKLGNSFQVFLASLGGATSGPINFIADALGNILKVANDLAKNPLSQWLFVIVGGAVALAGVLAALAAGAALGFAGIIALTRALQGLNAEGLGSTGIFAALRTELGLTGRAGAIASVGLGATAKAAGALGKALGVAGLVVGVSQLAGFFLKMGDNAANASIDVNKLKTSTAELDRFIAASNANKSSLAGAGNSTTKQITGGLAQATTGANSAFTQAGTPLKAIDDALGGLPGHISGLDQARETVDKLDGALAKLVKNGDTDAAAKAFDRLKTANEGSGVSFKDFSAQFGQYNKAVKDAVAATATLAANSNVTVASLNALKDATGLSNKQITDFGTSYAKSVNSLVDFNSVVGQVQTALNTAAQAQADASDGSKKASDFYDGTSVSLEQLTGQYNTNNAAQATWASNLVLLSSKYGADAANQFVQAGYSAVNSSILQQLVDATPAQAQAYIDASQQAAELAAQATANAILASPYLTGPDGGPISKSVSDAFKSGLSSGIPVETLMDQLGIRITDKPLKPVADVADFKAAVGALPAWAQAYVHPVVGVGADTQPAIDAANRMAAYIASKGIYVPVYTYNAGSRGASLLGGNAVTGATGGLYTGKAFKYATGGYVKGPGTGTSDSIQAPWLSNGEFVLKASAVKAYGLSYLNALNQSKVRAYAGGGSVGNSGPSAGSGSGIVELGPVSLRRLAREVSVNVMLDDVGIYNASRSGAKKVTNTGRY